MRLVVALDALLHHSPSSAAHTPGSGTALTPRRWTLGQRPGRGPLMPCWHTAPLNPNAVLEAGNGCSHCGWAGQHVWRDCAAQHITHTLDLLSQPLPAGWGLTAHTQRGLQRRQLGQQGHVGGSRGAAGGVRGGCRLLQ